MFLRTPMYFHHFVIISHCKSLHRLEFTLSMNAWTSWHLSWNRLSFSGKEVFFFNCLSLVICISICKMVWSLVTNDPFFLPCRDVFRLSLLTCIFLQFTRGSPLSRKLKRTCDSGNQAPPLPFPNGPVAWKRHMIYIAKVFRSVNRSERTIKSCKSSERIVI